MNTCINMLHMYCYCDYKDGTIVIANALLHSSLIHAFITGQEYYTTRNFDGHNLTSMCREFISAEGGALNARDRL
jgi:hypothetical protein